MIYRVIITGSRKYEWAHRVHAYLDTMLAYHPDLVVVAGDCKTGADWFALQWCAAHKQPVERHKADWTKGLIAGPVRNSEMAKAGADQCVGFWLPTHSRKENRGTSDMCSKALRIGIPVYCAFGDQAPTPWTARLFKAGDRNMQTKF